MFTNYEVRFAFHDNLCGSVPASPELIDKWLESRKPKVIPPSHRTIKDIQEEILNTVMEPDDPEEKLLVFQRFKGALCVRSATVRAHIKDCARVLSGQWVGKIQGERSFATRVINGVYLDETQYWLPILDSEGNNEIKQATGVREKAVHFRSRTGEQLSAIKCFEFVYQPSLRFTLKVLGKSANKKDLVDLFLYGGVHGYGGERGDGEGRYYAQITEKEN